MAYTNANWACISSSLNQGQLSVVPFGGSSTVENAPNIFMYGSPNDAVATIVAANYFLAEYVSLSVGDWIMGFGTDASFAVQVTAVSSSSVTVESTGLTTSIGTANIVNGAVTGPKLANPLVGSGSGFAFTETTASATPGTVRALKGVMSNTDTVMTSGNIVGVRGEVDLVGASGGFVYGVQGKVIPTGTLSGSEWTAAVFAQFDLSHPAVINAGQLATVWGDWGATGGTATDMSGARGFAFTNTTANVLNAQFYMYGPATNLLELDDNSGAYGASYFVAAGTSSGSAGYASGCNASKVLHITVNGTAYYIPLFAQNS
jgi:hypothetical protein